MAIETEPGTTQHPGGGQPAGGAARRPWWMRPAIHTGLIGAVIGYAFGHWLGNLIASGYQQVGTSDQNDTAIVLGYLFKLMAGRRLAEAENGNGPGGLAQYFRFHLDHKVVGIQYLVGMIIYFCTAGLLAMGIRTELLSPVHHVFSSATYIEIVGEHGTMMMMLMTSVILGPFGNYLIPIMIGSKRVAYPRLEALSFWLTPAAFM